MVKYLGVLNVTPDSFSDGGRFVREKEEGKREKGEEILIDKALLEAQQLFGAGASIVDVGGQSTRPGADEIGWEVEWERVEDVLVALKERLSDRTTEQLNDGTTEQPNTFSQISLDTKHPETAEKFLELGGKILNDVSGFQDPRMQEIACKFEMIIVNHFPGTTIGETHDQKISSIEKVVEDLLKTKEMLLEKGVKGDRIVLDPGIGFGKTMECNWALLKFAQFVPNERVLIGGSRKRFIDDLEAYREWSMENGVWKEEDFEALQKGRFSREANEVVERIAVNAGAEFLRVHEVCN